MKRARIWPLVHGFDRRWQAAWLPPGTPWYPGLDTSIVVAGVTVTVNSDMCTRWGDGKEKSAQVLRVSLFLTLSFRLGRTSPAGDCRPHPGEPKVTEAV